MVLDSEKQRQDLISLLHLVPFQGNLAQGVDKLVDEVKALIAVIQKAEVKDQQDMK